MYKVTFRNLYFVSYFVSFTLRAHHHPLISDQHLLQSSLWWSGWSTDQIITMRYDADSDLTWLDHDMLWRWLTIWLEWQCEEIYLASVLMDFKLLVLLGTIWKNTKNNLGSLTLYFIYITFLFVYFKKRTSATRNSNDYFILVIYPGTYIDKQGA